MAISTSAMMATGMLHRRRRDRHDRLVNERHRDREDHRGQHQAL
jgi:hypothetical protein